MMNKKLIATLSAAAMVFAVSACGSSDGGSGSHVGEDGKTVIQWGMWGSGTGDMEFLEKTKDIVESQLGDVTIDLQSAAWSDYWTKLTTNISGGQTSCVLGINSGKLDTYAEAFSPLTEEDFKTMGIDPADYGPGVLDMMKQDGKQIGIPYDVATMLVYTNQDAIADAGIAELPVDWSFEDFENAAQAVSDKGDIRGFAVSPAEFQWLSLPIDKSGVQPVSDDGQLQLTDPKLLEAMEWYAGLVTDKKVADPIDTASSVGWGEDQFSNGNAAMAVDGTWNAIGYIQGSDDEGAPTFETGFHPMPKGEAGRTSLLLGSGYGISATCSDRDNALRVLGALVSKEAQDLLSSTGRSYPALTASQDAYFEQVPKGQGAALKETFDLAFESAQPLNHNATWAQVSDSFGNALVGVYNGQDKMADAMNTIQQQFGN